MKYCLTSSLRSKKKGFISLTFLLNQVLEYVCILSGLLIYYQFDIKCAFFVEKMDRTGINNEQNTYKIIKNVEFSSNIYLSFFLSSRQRRNLQIMILNEA